MPNRERCTTTILSLALAGTLMLGLAANAAAQSGMWSVLPVSGAKPSARKHHTMVYDPVNNRVVLFGGEDPGPTNDVWVLHLGGTPYWEPITPAGATPPPLHGHNAVFDAANNRMLVFNGRMNDSVTVSAFPDSVRALSWNGPWQWSRLFKFPTRKIHACSPQPSYCAKAYARRTHSAAAVIGNALFVMGGQSGPGMIPMGDLWTHTIGTTQWTWMSGSPWGLPPGQCDACIDPGDVNTPDLRFYHSMIADGFGRLVVFGGIYDEVDVSNAFVSVGGGPWAFLGNVPEFPYNFGRKHHAAVFDPVRGRMVVVGGYLGSGGETYEATGDVTSLPLPEVLPQYTGQDDVNENWVLHPNCGPDPGPMAEHAAVYDSQGDRVIVFGGLGDGSGTYRNNDVWVLSLSDIDAPAAVTLEPAQVGQTSSTIQWTAPGDDGNTGTACAYDLRRSEQPITEANFSSATQLGTDSPSPAGTPECGTTGPNIACTTYFYALKTIDDGGNVSLMSNVLAVQQTCSGVSYACPGGGGGFRMTATQPQSSTLSFGVRGENPPRGPVLIELGIPAARAGEALELALLNVAGKRIRTLLKQVAAAGDLELEWDLRDDAGSKVASGVYFARLRIGAESHSRKIVVAQGR